MKQRHARSRGPRDPRHPPCASRAACAPNPLPSPCACRHVAATAVCCQVQRGLAIASQTLASELSIKCERLQARLEPHAPAGANGAALHHPPPTPMATPSGAPLGGGGA